MKKRHLALTLGSIITGTLILFSSCRKINEATELGGDLIPTVDNITTFDTTLTVEAYSDFFTLGGTLADSLRQDTIRSLYSDEQFLGLINNDQLFGSTDAQMFFELKPPVFPYTFANKKDSISLDSVVLVLDYVESYGDTLVPQTIDVSEITSTFRADTTYLMRKNTDFTVGASLGSRTILPAGLDDSVKNFLDTTSHQLRIRLNNSFGNRLLAYDTLSAGGNNAYSSDSTFELKFKGFALKSTAGGKALMGFNLQGPNTKLAIYYKYLHGVGTDLDTTVTYFIFKPFNDYVKEATAAHNYVKRDYSGGEITTVLGGTTPDGLVYIQNSPGTFATIKIPALAGLSNRVVHRAELIAEQVYHPTDTLFPPPAFLYLDAYSPTTSRFRNIPYDVSYDATSSSFNLNSFGVSPVNKLDGAGKLIRTWHFNISRYVQHIVNGTEPLYDLRLFAPYYTKDQYYLPIPNAEPVTGAPDVFVNPKPIIGRVRLAGGTVGAGAQRMRLRIVYSKI